VDALRRVYREPGLAREVGARGRSAVRSQLSLEACGARMAARLGGMR
jgi:hypothetical protein